VGKVTATDERTALDAGALLLRLAEVEHERDELRAALLASADAIEVARASWADGYRAGFEAGAEVGNGRAAYVEARCAESHDVGWHGIADHEIDAGQRARLIALDRRRYPPGGRLSWLHPKLGDLYQWWTDYDSEGGQ
jgi:hypothetical protein